MARAYFSNAIGNRDEVRESQRLDNTQLASDDRLLIGGQRNTDKYCLLHFSDIRKMPRLSPVLLLSGRGFYVSDVRYGSKAVVNAHPDLRLLCTQLRT